MQRLRSVISHWSGSFRDNRDGAVSIWLAGGLVAMLGISGMAVDMSYFYVMRDRLQTAADSAALAGAVVVSNPTAMRQEAKKYAQLNVPGDPNILSDADIVAGYWDHDARTFAPGGNPQNAVRVIARMSQASGNPAGTFFAAALGIDEVDITASAVAAFDPADDWDFVIAQDVTSSFSVEIADARDANQAMLDCIKDSATGGQDPLWGMVLFTGVSTIYKPLQSAVSSYSDLSEAIDDLALCGQSGMPACSGTHVAPGINAAIDVFEDSPHGSEINRAIVVVGDGDPNPSGPNSSLTVQQMKVLANQAADAAEAQGMSVFTVFFDETNDDVAAAFFEGLTRGKGKFMRTPDASDLPELLLSICTQTALRLVD